MAMRILSSRLLSGNMPRRVCVTSNASMSSSSENLPKPTEAEATAPTTRKKKLPDKEESFISRWAYLIPGAKLEPADPDEPPIDPKEVRIPESVERCTGEEKLYLLAFENGILDPYCNLPIKRGDRGKTREDAIKIESFFDYRRVACTCEPNQTFYRYTMLLRDEPKRCHCGYWLELVDAPRFWLNLPKEDLLDIQFFRDLQDEGILDKYLAGEISDKDVWKLAEGHGDGHH